jgi:S-adenosylmethionine decarboxylase
MNAGQEWIVDALGCSPDRLADLAAVRAACDAVVRDLRLQVVGVPHWHRFPAPGGVTGLYLLSESHLACHTFPEHGLATFNLYCCRPRAEWPWEARLVELLDAERVELRCVARGDVFSSATRQGAPR